MCEGSTVSSLRRDGNDDSVVAELKRSHVHHGGTGPLMPIGQSGRGMLGADRPWERPCRRAEGWRGENTQRSRVKERK